MQLVCGKCGWLGLAGYTEKVEWLRQLKRLRRTARPEPELVDQLFDVALRELPCPDCRVIGLSVASPDDSNDGGWLESRACDRCGAVIPAERLEIFPDTRYCTACQRSIEQGVGGAGAHDYCPRCGSVMSVRSVASRQRSGYQLVCHDCGYRGT